MGYGGTYWHFDSPCGIWLSAGGFSFSTNPQDVWLFIGIANKDDYHSTSDVYVVDGGHLLPLSNGVEITDLGWQLDDFSGTAFDSNSLPTTAPVLSAWDNNYLSIEGGPRGMEFGINATVTYVEVVPEPATILLIAVSVVFFRKHSV